MGSKQPQQQPQPIYSNQSDAGGRIFAHFAGDPGIRLATLLAPTQWGKTGCAIDIMRRFHNAEGPALRIDPDHTYVITAQSDRDWHAQTSARVGHCTRHVYYRNQLQDFVDHAKARAGLLIVLDEVHIGTSINQQLRSYFEEAGLLDIDALVARNVRIVQISATPGAVLLDARRWGRHHVVEIAPLPPAYVGLATMRDEGRIREAEPLTPDVAARLCEIIRDRWPDEPRIHILRAYAGKKKAPAIQEALATFERQGIEILYHDSKQRIRSIDDLLAGPPPAHHTLLIIKGFWRQAKTLHDRHLGICYETSSTTDFNTVVQGLPGRLTGYGRQRGDRAPIVFCHVRAVDAWIEWYAGGCDYRSLDEYKSAKLTVRVGTVVRRRGTAIHESVVRGLPEEDPDAGDGTIRDRHTVATAPIRATGDVFATLPEGGMLLTSFEELAPQAFLDRYLPGEDPAVLAGSAVLSQALRRCRVPANLCFATHWRQRVADLRNFYEHPGWAGKELHILRQGGGASFAILRRDLALLRALPDPAPAAGFFGHTPTGQLAKYTRV